MDSELSSLITRDEQDMLVQYLLACDGSKEFWDKIISELPEDIKIKFDEAANQQMRVSNLVRRCLAVQQGIESLLNRVRAYKGGSDDWVELARTAFHLLTRFPDSYQHLSEQLVDIIEEINPDPPQLRKLQQNLSIGRTFRPISGYQTVLHLFQLTDKAIGIRFLQSLADEVDDIERQTSLRQWCEETAKLFSVSSERLHSPVGGGKSGKFLSIQLQPVTPDNERFKIFSWLDTGAPIQSFYDSGGRAFNLTEAIDAIGKIASLAFNNVGNELEVELIVRRDVFCHDVTCWQRTVVGDLKRALIRDMPLVLRCSERVEARRTQLARGKEGPGVAQATLAALMEGYEDNNQINLGWWRDKCAALDARTDQEVEMLLYPIAKSVPDLNKLMDELQPDGKGLCVGLGFVPPITPPMSDEISIAIAAGVPIIFWFRALPDGRDLDELKLKELFSGSKVKLSELRRYLWQLRREAVINNSPDDHYRHLTLLYDDYNRVPPAPPNEAPALKVA
jgi:hypothetical protein